MAMIPATKTYWFCIDANPNEAIQDPDRPVIDPEEPTVTSSETTYRTYAYEDICPMAVTMT